MQGLKSHLEIFRNSFFDSNRLFIGSKTHFWHFEPKIIFTSDTINPSIAECAGKMSIFEERKKEKSEIRSDVSTQSKRHPGAPKSRF